MDRSALALLARDDGEPSRDTLVDVPAAKRVIRARGSRRHFDRGPGEERVLEAPRPRGAPIAESEALSPASLARVRVREAVVRLHRTARPIEVETPPPPPSASPSLRIEWFRSSDRGLRLARHGADGVKIFGTATADGVLSIGVDARMYSIRLAAGDTAAEIADRLAARVELAFLAEVLERTPDRAIIRLADAI